MAFSVNKATLLGNVGKEPEYKVTPNGTPICKFSIATVESFKNSSDQWENRTEWHNIECWRNIADIANKNLTKGTKVYIEGKIKTDSYEKDGVTKYSTKIVATEIVLLQKSDATTTPSEPPKPVNDKPNSYSKAPEPEITDVPF